MRSAATMIRAHVIGEMVHYPSGEWRPYEGEAHLFPNGFKHPKRTVVGRPHPDASTRQFRVDQAVFDSWAQAMAVRLPEEVVRVRANGHK